MATNKNIKINLDYSDFSGGIRECQSKMSLLNNEFKLQQAQMGNNASEVDKLSLTQSTLNQKIQLQTQIVAQNLDKWEAMADSEETTIAQVERAHAAYQKSATVLEQMKNELEQTSQKLDELGNEAEESADDVNDNADSMDNLVNKCSTAISTISNLAAAFSALGEKLGELARKSTEYADELNTLSAKTSMSTETLQEWSYAANFVDTSLDTMTSSMTKLTRNMAEAQSGSGSAAEAFRSLGISVQDGHGQLKSAESVFMETIDALGQIENAAERDATAMTLFGKSAQELNPLIEAGSIALQAYGQEAQNLGLVMSGEQITALNMMNDSFDRLNATMDMASMSISAGFAPILSGLADMVSSLPQPVLVVISTLGTVISTLSTLAPIMTGINSVVQLGTITSTAHAGALTVEAAGEVALGTAAAAANIPLLAQVAIAALLVAGFILIMENLDKIEAGFRSLAEAASNACEAIRELLGLQSQVDSTSSSGGQHFASGGYTPGGQVWVGEQGAELVDLPRGSYVHNSTDSRNQSRNQTIYNVTIDAKSVSDFNKVISVFSGLDQSMSRGGAVNG